MHDYLCPVCPFASYDWPTKKAAADRGKQHEYEHAEGVPMPELVESGVDGATPPSGIIVERAPRPGAQKES